jgi:hypothetical protein
MKYCIALFFATFILTGCIQNASTNQGGQAESNENATSKDTSNVTDNETVSPGDPIDRDDEYYRSKGYQIFGKYNLAVKVPVVMEDGSMKTSGDHDFVYGGFVNQNDPEKLTFYQIIINDLPDSYRNFDDSEREEFEKNWLEKTMDGQHKKVRFLEHEAVVMEYSQNGYGGRSIMFLRGGRSYGFNVITNDNLTRKFNSLTNKIKFY